MSEQQNPEGQRRQSREAWEEVGKQFQTLGESLSMAFRAAWEDEETRARVQEMRSGIEKMVNQVGDAIRETADSPQGQKMRSEAGKAAENVRAAGEQTMAEIRPHLVAALRQVNSELQRMINRMDEKPAGTAAEETPPPRGDRGRSWGYLSSIRLDVLQRRFDSGAPGSRPAVRSARHCLSRSSPSVYTSFR